MGAIIARAVTLYARGTHSGCVVGNPSLTGLWKGRPVYCGWLIAVGWFSSCCNCSN